MQIANFTGASAQTSTLTMSSREIAELTGKSHAHVMRDIRVMLEVLKKMHPVLDRSLKTRMGATNNSFFSTAS